MPLPPADTGPVAYQGGPGAFSEAAADRLAPGEERAPCRTFDEVFEGLRRGAWRRAVLPVENTIHGPVGPVVDGLAALPHRVLGEAWLPIDQALVAPPGVPFEALRRVRSHPVALAQCRTFLAAHPHLEAVEDDDTALAVARVVREARGDEAALGSARAAALYGGVVLVPAVQDCADNATRLLLIEVPG